MGWRSTLVLLGLVLVVGAYLWLVDTPPPPRRSDRQQGAESAQALPKLLAFDPADVVDMQLQRAHHTRSVQRRDGAWQGTDDPAGITDFLHTLAELRVLMDISATASAKELADYGLDPPLAVIVLHVNGRTAPLIVQMGDHNPATTGVYVRIGADGTVVLAGALVEWEFDNLFKRLGAEG
jgi:hypothetical protein